MRPSKTKQRKIPVYFVFMRPNETKGSCQQTKGRWQMDDSAYSLKEMLSDAPAELTTWIWFSLTCALKYFQNLVLLGVLNGVR